MKRLAGILAGALWLAAIPATAQERPAPALKAGAERTVIGNYRDSYTQLGFNAFTLEWDFVTRGAEGSFSAAYHRPVIGLGLSYNTLGDVIFSYPNGHYSDMLTAYGIFTRDLLVWGPLRFGYDLSLGLSYTKDYYDPLTNGANWFFSSPVMLYVSGGGHLCWELGPRLDLIGDIVFKHNSSARLSYPNTGLNYWGGGLSLRYHFEARPPGGHEGFRTPRIDGSRFTKGWSWEIHAGGGVHACAAEWQAAMESMEWEDFARQRFRKWPMASLGLDAIYRLSGRFGLGLCADAFYASNSDALRQADLILHPDEADGAQYAPFSCGIGVVQEVFYRDVAFYLQEGVYLYRKTGIQGYHGPFYEKAGFRWYASFLRPFFLGASIKAHYFKADYLDFTLGLRFSRKQ